MKNAHIFAQALNGDSLHCGRRAGSKFRVLLENDVTPTGSRPYRRLATGTPRDHSNRLIGRTLNLHGQARFSKRTHESFWHTQYPGLCGFAREPYAGIYQTNPPLWGSQISGFEISDCPGRAVTDRRQRFYQTNPSHRRWAKGDSPLMKHRLWNLPNEAIS